MGKAGWRAEEVGLLRDLSELNINKGGERIRRAPPSRNDIESFEQNFNVKLPESYVSLLMYANGGHPQLDFIQPILRPDAAGRTINHFYHLDGDKTSTRSLWAATVLWRKVLGNCYIPIAQDGGGNPFVLEMSSSPPSVKACLHDENFVLVDMAPSFEAFIDALTTDPDEI